MIITSLLDTDLYKFTMMQAVLHQFPGAQVEYRFKCRNPGCAGALCAVKFVKKFAHLCQLRFQDAELDYLRSLRFIKSDFVDFLSLFKLNEKYITITPHWQWRDRHRHPRPVAARRFLLNSGAGHRQRGVFRNTQPGARLSGGASSPG